MTVYLSPVGNGQQFLLANGLPNNGGFINTYLAGTSTPATTYTTSIGNVSNANPIAMSTGGVLPNEIWLTSGVSYKFVITDSLGAVIQTLDNLDGINDSTNIFTRLLTSIGSSLIGFIAAAAGAVLRTVQAKLRDEISVTDFGGVGDGTTDCTGAINAANLAVFLGVQGGGRVKFPFGNYLATSAIYTPSGVTWCGDGMKCGPALANDMTNVEGSCVIGKHTGVAIVSMKGSQTCSIQHMSLFGHNTVTPQTGLILGRSSSASAGRHYFEQCNVLGYFSQAACYFIASEENVFNQLHWNVIGGTAKYGLYTSDADDLSIDTMHQGSNWQNAFFGGNYLHQGSVNNSASIYINVRLGAAGSTQGWLFKGGFTGMTSGTTSAHVQINLADNGASYTRDFVFEDIGCEAVSNASPPVQVFHVTNSSGGATVLRGLRLKNNTNGQALAGTAYYLYVDDSINLVDAQIEEAASTHPSSVFTMNECDVNLPEQDFTVRSVCNSSNVRARQIYHAGSTGTYYNNVSQTPVIYNQTYTGTGPNNMVFDSTNLYSGLIARDFIVKIDATGTPDTFKWSQDGGLTYVATGVAITGAAQTLTAGVVIKFGTTTGHTLNDYWTFLCDPSSLPNYGTRLNNLQIAASGASNGFTGSDDTSVLAFSASRSATATTMQLSGTTKSGTPGNVDFYHNGNFNVSNATGATTFFVVDQAGTATRSGRDGSDNCGLVNYRWNVVYAVTGAINTSDEREKSAPLPIEDAALRAWAKVDYCQFKFLDAISAKGDKSRWHYGVIAQRVKDAFESEGLDPFSYGLLCYDEWDAKEEIIDEETGRLVQQAQTAGNRYGIRYEEALVLECAYLRSLIQNKQVQVS